MRSSSFFRNPIGDVVFLKAQASFHQVSRIECKGYPSVGSRAMMGAIIFWSEIQLYLRMPPLDLGENRGKLNGSCQIKQDSLHS